MFVFQSAFLTGLHGITIIDPCSSCAIRAVFHLFCQREFGPSVSEQDMDIFSEYFRAKDGFQKVHALLHGKRSFFFMQDAEKDPWAEKEKGLNKRAVRNVVINGVHLCNKNFRMFRNVFLIVFVETSLKIVSVDSLFEAFGELFGNLSGYLTSEIQHGDIRNFSKDASFNIIVKGLFADTEFRMAGYNAVGRVPLF